MESTQLDLFLKPVQAEEPIKNSEEITIANRKNFGFSGAFLERCFDYTFLRGFYVGLKESGLSKPLMDLMNGNEIAAFCAGVGKDKSLYTKNTFGFKSSLFKEYFRLGFPFFNLVKQVRDQKDIETEQILNPYTSDSFSARSEKMPEVAFDDLVARLGEQAKQYVTEGQYFRIKKERNGDNTNLEILTFLPMYLGDKDRSKYKSNFAKAIMDILKAESSESSF